MSKLEVGDYVRQMPYPAVGRIVEANELLNYVWVDYGAPESVPVKALRSLVTKITRAPVHVEYGGQVYLVKDGYGPCKNPEASEMRGYEGADGHRLELYIHWGGNLASWHKVEDITGDEKVKEKFKVGDRVILQSEPFKGQSGKVVGVHPSHLCDDDYIVEATMDSGQDVVGYRTEFDLEPPAVAAAPDEMEAQIKATVEKLELGIRVQKIVKQMRPEILATEGMDAEQVRVAIQQRDGGAVHLVHHNPNGSFKSLGVVVPVHLFNEFSKGVFEFDLSGVFRY